MARTLSKLKLLVPRWPRKRYNIFSGANTWDDWWTVLGHTARIALGGGSPSVEMFEDAFSEAVGSGTAVSFGAGRMALYALLEAFGVGRGDEVVMPAFTCVVVPNAVIYRGAKPVYVDIEPRTFNMNVELLRAAITDRTKLIIAQHTFGVACDIDRIGQIARDAGVPVVEDCGHALGARHRGRPVGTFGDAAFFTTDHSKVVNTFLGGMVTTADACLAERVRTVQAAAGRISRGQELRMAIGFLAEFLLYAPPILWLGTPIMSVLWKVGLPFSWRDEGSLELPTTYPYPALLPGILASIGPSQMARLRENLAHRRRIAAMLERQIGWTGWDDNALRDPSWIRYSFLVRDRNAFVRRFAGRFDLGIWFTSVTQGRRERLEAVGYRSGSCHVAEVAASHIVNFPTHPRIPLPLLEMEVERNREWVRDQLLTDVRDVGVG
ncbi:DegT/DnrJ/EryC1/StrS family aminotransferase [Gemmatimonadota bacterium]